MKNHKESLSNNALEKKNISPEKKEISVQDIEKKLDEIGRLSETKVLKKEVYDELQDTLTTIWTDINTLKKIFEKKADSLNIQRLEELETTREKLQIDIKTIQDGFKKELDSFKTETFNKTYNTFLSTENGMNKEAKKQRIAAAENIENLPNGNNIIANRAKNIIKKLST